MIGGNLIPDSDDERNIGAAGSEFKDLHIDGTANIDTLSAGNAIGDLTDNRVVIAGSGGELEDRKLNIWWINIRVTGDITSDRITVGSGVTLFSHGGAAIAGITTIGGT